jgi:hypothetical protein
MDWLREQQTRHDCPESASFTNEHQVFDHQMESEGARALDLVNQAAAVIRDIEERAAETAVKAETIAKRALQALERAEERISQIHAERCAAEQRAEAAETQAREARASLIAVEDAIRTMFLKRSAETAHNLAAAA